MAQWVSDNGNANFKQAWNKLLDQYPGDYDAAMAKWVELFPNQIPFTVTESDKKTVAVVRYFSEEISSGKSLGFVKSEQDFRVRPSELTVVTGVSSHGKSLWLSSQVESC